MGAGNLASHMPSLTTPGSSIWRESCSHIPTFVKVRKEFKKLIVFEETKKWEKKEKTHSRTSYSIKIVNSRSRLPNNSLIRFREEARHLPQNHKVCEIAAVTTDPFMGWPEAAGSPGLVEDFLWGLEKEVWTSLDCPHLPAAELGVTWVV